MSQWINIYKNTYYMESPVKVGLYFSGDGKAFLIDSGIDKDGAKKILRFIEEKSRQLDTIINTHSHGDHCGGNRYLQERTGCKIYSSEIEASIMRNTIIEPSFLYGGAPFKELRNKYFMAPDSVAENIDNADLPEGFEYISLPGHYFGQIGVRTPDEVWFIGDSLMGEETFEKHSFIYMYNFEDQFESLKKLSKLQGEWFVPAHGKEVNNLEPLIEINRKNMEIHIEAVKRLLLEDLTFEDLLAKVFEETKIPINQNQYILIGATLKSMLSYLKDRGETENYFLENKQYWKNSSLHRENSSPQ